MITGEPTIRGVKAEQRREEERKNCEYYISTLNGMKFPKTTTQSKISDYIVEVKELLTTEFGQKKGTRTALNNLEKEYKIKNKIGTFGNTTVQEFVNYYNIERNWKNYELVNGMGDLQISIAKKIIEKIKESIEN